MKIRKMKGKRARIPNKTIDDKDMFENVWYFYVEQN